MAQVSLKNVRKTYPGGVTAVDGVDLEIATGEFVVLVGPSGCGKSTVLRCFNRMNDLIETARVTGTIEYHGIDLYDERVDPVEVRRRVGMVFQKPNPFPKSIFDNVAYGPRVAGQKKGLDEVVESSLRKAALWDEVKDRLRDSALGLSGGQQQRLCIARTLAVHPEVVLMDEPCSALDPKSTAHIEELIRELREQYGRFALFGGASRANEAVADELFLLDPSRRAGARRVLRALSRALTSRARQWPALHVATSVLWARFRAHAARAAQPALRAQDL